MNTFSIWLGILGIFALTFGWNEIQDTGGVRVSETTRRWREAFGGSEETRKARRLHAPIAVAAGILLLTGSIFALVHSSLPNADGIVRLAHDDPRAIAVKQEAQSHLSQFVDQWNDRVSTPDHSFGIKRDFADGDLHEHMWIDVAAFDGQTFSGTVSDEPVDVTNVSMGDPASTRMDDVEDWAVFDAEGGLVAGGFLYQSMR